MLLGMLPQNFLDFIADMHAAMVESEVAGIPALVSGTAHLMPV